MSDDDSIESGGVNSARTKAKCHCCKTVFQFDPSWTSASECPSCEEDLFCYTCVCCEGGYGSSEPPFPDIRCCECGKTAEEQEEEHNREQRLIDEKERVKNGANFRAAKIREPFPVYQNNIMLTYRALYGKARPGAPPVSEGDALRMKDEDWAMLRPLLCKEIGDDADTILTIDWCRYQINVFERS